MATSFNEGSFHTTRGRFAFQVFLSFRGEDVRKGFVDHLHHALLQRGISTFHDDSALERGDDIQSNLYEAIELSELSIVTFSSGYASSRWCLDELVKIMECRVCFGHIVLPVFYDVDPSVVRHQSGLYKQAFDAHEVRFKNDLERVRKWREALRAAADLAGFFLLNQADGHEARFIQNIIKEVIKKLDRRSLMIPRNVVGVESIVEDIRKWLQDGSEDVGVGVIYGLGGVGKSTVAKIVFNNNCDNFEGSSFLADIRRVSQQDKGFVGLQRQLISNISRNESDEIYNIPEGMAKISQVLCSRRILLVLDDVDELEQLYGMFDYPEWFFPGSKIIITTRNQRLQSVQMFVKQFPVCTLNGYQSSQLFCLHAFAQDHPLRPYMKVVEQFIQYCGGLPLALEVLASSLRGKPVALWESQLAKLQNFPNKKIHDILKWSFDSIEDENDRDIFLHIAFYLVGLNKSYTFMILEGCDLYAEIGFQNLVDRCLVTIDDHYNVSMHQLIQEMAREVVRQEAFSKPGRRSRLWNHKETLNVLRNNEGTVEVRGLRLEFPVPISAKVSKDDIYTKVEHSSKHFGLACILPSHPKVVSINLESVTTDAFTEMKSLNLLQLKNVQLEGSYEDFPKALKWLSWQGCSLETIPEDFDLYKLVVLDMRSSCLIHAWEGIKFLGVLRVLNLSNSPFLTDTPDFSSALALEWIILIDCRSLVRIHGSIGFLKKLTILNLKGCKNLCGFPKSMSELCSLQVLDLSGCSHLLKVPGNIESSIIRFSHASIRRLPLVDKSESSLSLLGQVSTAPRVSFNLFPQLEWLILAKCDISRDTIFDYFSCLSSLQYLDLSENPLSFIDKNLGHFTELRFLTLRNCANLQSISPVPSRCCVTLQGCNSLETIEILHSSVLIKFSDIYAYDCPKLVDIGGLLKLEWTGSMDANRARYLGFPDLELHGDDKRMACAPSLGGLYHGGTYSVFLFGDHAAKWFTEITVGLKLKYTVPSIPDHKIRAFNVCCVYECGQDSYISGTLKIKNLSRKWEWRYFPSIYPDYPVSGKERDVTLLTHWCAMEHRELMAGDELNIWFNFEHGSVVPFKYGIKIVYEEEDEDENENEFSGSFGIAAIPEEEGGADLVEEQLSVAVWYDNMFRRNVDLASLEDKQEKGWYNLETSFYLTGLEMLVTFNSLRRGSPSFLHL